MIKKWTAWRDWVTVVGASKSFVEVHGGYNSQLLHFTEKNGASSKELVQTLLSQKMFYSWIWAQSKPKSRPASTFLLRCVSCVLKATTLQTSTATPLAISAHSQEHFLTTGFPGTWCPLLLASSSWMPAPRYASCSPHTALSQIRHLPVHAIVSTLGCLKPMNFVGEMCSMAPFSSNILKLQMNL